MKGYMKHHKEMSGLKIGLVRLGRAGGKIKHALLDEDDFSMAEDLTFESRVDVDPNGHGAQVFAWCYDKDLGRAAGDYVHNLVWEKHCGGIAPDWKVVHRNGITMDNRLDNLTLVQGNKEFVPQKEEKSNKESKEESLYYLAIANLPVDPLQEFMYFSESERIYNRYYISNGEVVEETDSNMYYECHHPPCTNIEKELQQFSFCSRCLHVRYCGVQCQSKDWPVHKRFCRHRRRPAPYTVDREIDR